MSHPRKAASCLTALALLLAISNGAAGEAAGEASGPETGRIVGTARRAADGAPIPSGSIDFFDAENRPRGHAEVDDGAFASAGLAPGTYYALIFDTRTEIGQFHGWQACQIDPLPRHCDKRRGEPIAVVAGQDTVISFSLLPGAFLGGNVLAPGGAPVENAIVRVFDSKRGEIWARRYPSPGPFYAGPFPPGSYRVQASAPDLPTQFYPDQVCIDACDSDEGEAIPVAPGEIRRAIDIRLQAPGRLTGWVVDATGAGIPGAPVLLFAAATQKRALRERGYAQETDGRFVIEKLPPGDYLVVAGRPLWEWRAFPDTLFFQKDLKRALASAQRVVVPAGRSKELPPLRLRRLGVIRGRVLDWTANGSQSTPTVATLAFRRDGEPAVRRGSSRDGSFEIAGLEPGTYYVLIDGPDDRDLLIGSGEPCAARKGDGPFPYASCDVTRGTPFEVDFDETALAGDFELPAAEPAGSAPASRAPVSSRRLAVIRGRVIGAAADDRLGKTEVVAFRSDGVAVRRAHVGDYGSFELADLEPGTYHLLVDGQEGRDLLVGGNEACLAQKGSESLPYATCDITRGKRFEMSLGERADAGKISLPKAARIRGTFRLAPGREGRPYLRVSTAGHPEITGITTGLQGGEWFFDISLPGGGTYYLVGMSDGHLAQLYDHLDCAGGQPESCPRNDPRAAISLAPGEVRDGVVFDLALEAAAKLP